MIFEIIVKSTFFSQIFIYERISRKNNRNHSRNFYKSKPIPATEAWIDAGESNHLANNEILI